MQHPRLEVGTFFFFFFLLTVPFFTKPKGVIEPLTPPAYASARNPQLHTIVYSLICCILMNFVLYNV